MSADILLREVPLEDLEAVWLTAAPLIDKAVAYSHGDTDIDCVHEELATGESKLLIVSDAGEMIAAIVLDMHQHPRKRICVVALAGGTQKELWCRQVMPHIEKIAKAAGADAVYINGRRGWLRELGSVGYSEYATVIGKEI